jgi:tripartite-type tricarboxylate transporter receptor subunit TctC
MLRVKYLFRIAAALAVFAAAAAAAGAQQYPARPVTLIVPFPAGGPTDVVARALAPLMEQAWKQSFIVEFRPGAGGMLGTEVVARAKPDGYTLLLNSDGVYAAKIFIKNLTYDPADLRPVVDVGGASLLVVTNPSVPTKTLSELVSYVKSHSGSVNTGSIPNNTSDLDIRLLGLRTGMNFTVVPYNGLPDIISAALRNDVQFFLAVPTSVQQLLTDGKLRAIVTAGTQRNERFPDVPTARESGVDFLSVFAFGIWVPAKAPADIVARIGTDVAMAVLTPEYGARMKNLSYQVSAQPLAYPATTERKVKEYFELAKQIGIEPH